MKLGSQTGSLTNHLYSRMVINQPEAAVGMGATVMGWTDRYGCTVIDVFKKGSSQYVTVQEDHAKRTDKNGMSDDQDYEYTPNEEGRTWTFKKEKDGRWSEVLFSTSTNRYKKHGSGSGMRLGVRDRHYDYSF